MYSLPNFYIQWTLNEGKIEKKIKCTSTSDMGFWITHFCTQKFLTGTGFFVRGRLNKEGRFRSWRKVTRRDLMFHSLKREEPALPSVSFECKILYIRNEIRQLGSSDLTSETFPSSPEFKINVCEILTGPPHLELRKFTERKRLSENVGYRLYMTEWF